MGVARFPSQSGGNLTEGGKQVQTPSCRFPLPAGGTEQGRSGAVINHRAVSGY